jgi:DDE superfamily endonuclease
LDESNCYRTVCRIEDILIKSRAFRLPGRKALLGGGPALEVVLIDASESVVERLKKKQRRFYSGKKKRHTLKAQVVVQSPSAEVICTAFGRGREHDFRLFKRSRVRLSEHTQARADKGYTGLKKLHSNSLTPHKARKNQPLCQQQHQENRVQNQRRALVENVLGRLKVFRILCSRHRNRRRRFGLRFNLIAGLYNFELLHA